jgi:hypothetical protein
MKGINGNSRPARRFREIATALARDLGGEAALGEAAKLQVRHAAAVAVQLEGLQEQIIRGEAIDLEQLTRLANVHSRALKDLGIKAVPEPKELTLGEYLASGRSE